ncbi:EAL domain-containing protein [Vibrio ziniensis]|uniref:EAL domain-containing protein n=1 Tax=Vibrio ziniensis TaxID=2711221 RepID=A0A6G7CMS4_9VIBR|nr:EAL domain-containing protein [Vibrio ziniensis]QIH43348.1 EAL domain-containing protein [Vibrio ziniensis]
MAKLFSFQSLYNYLSDLIEKNVTTDDDAMVFEAFKHNDIRHACQAIRETAMGEVEYQHLTLRFGSRGEQSVYQFELSDKMAYCLDLYSLYLALRQTRFQLDTFHPSLISNVVVPLRGDTLLWPHGKFFVEQLFEHHMETFSHIVPSIQVQFPLSSADELKLFVEQIQKAAYAVWFELYAPCEDFEQVTLFKPDMIKLAVTLENKEDRQAFLPIARFLRQRRYKWVAGRVASKIELNQYRLLGASYYFGYFSDIPTSMSFRNFDVSDNDYS